MFYRNDSKKINFSWLRSNLSIKFTGSAELDYVFNDLSIGSTETKYIILKLKIFFVV